MDVNLTVGQHVLFQGQKHEIVDIFHPLGTYPVYNVRRGSYTKRAFRYQLEVNFMDSDDDDLLSTIDCSDLGLRGFTVPYTVSAPTNSTPAQPIRFVQASDTDVDKIQSSKDEKFTASSTQWGVKVFQDWLTFREYSGEFWQFSANELNDKLRHFYVEARTKDGNLYSKSALVGIRAALNRYLQAPPHKLNVNIMKDRAFTSSNHVLVGLVKELKRQGNDTTKHKEAISGGDILKLFESGTLSTGNPLSLVRKVWFDVMYHFGRRGREGLRNLTPQSFVFDRDDSGNEFVAMAYNESNKTHHGIDSRETLTNVRMYATGDDRCPVASLRLYLDKRSKGNNAFFQRPLLNISISADAECWFYNQAMGVKTLSSMMASISADAKLSQRYTNHCVRATCATVLNDAGVDVHGIMAVTGHRNEASVRSYVQRPSVDQRRSLSMALHSAVQPVDPDARAITPLPASTPSTCSSSSSFSQANTSLTQVNLQKFPQGFLQNANISGGTFNFSFHS